MFISYTPHKKSKPITYNGRTQSLLRWSLELNIPYETLWQRLRRGWDVEKSFTTEVEPRENHYIVIDGEVGTLHSWCRKLNLPYISIYQLVKYGGFSPEEVIMNAMNRTKEEKRRPKAARRRQGEGKET